MIFKPSSLVLKSYAKINVSLRVLGRNKDGYHDLEMVFLPLDLHDVIEISKFPHSPDSFITCDDIGLQNEHHNLCMKALELMRKQYGFKEEFNIHIHKEIPFAAGLGGGSSNAATVMMGLVQLLRLKTEPEVLNHIALQIGADVPYFFNPKPAKVSGIGEVIEPFKVKKSYFCLLIKPKEGLHTKTVYEACDAYFDKDPLRTSDVIKALQEGDDALLESSMHNDLYEPAKKLLPVVGEIVSSLKKNGFPLSAMTGSGSACFALSNDLHKCKEAMKKYESHGYSVILTKTC
jgi:4-diphosphocytidyl-2-C-methyl-D-erythritol kinase